VNEHLLIPDQNELRYAYERAHECYETARRLVFDVHCDAEGHPVAAPLTAVEKRILRELAEAEANVKHLRRAFHSRRSQA
jgi:hypothetical protein